MATGQELLGTSIYGNNLKALYINAEDSRTEMLRRLWALCLEHGLAEQDLARMCLLGVDNWQVQQLSFLWTERGASVLHQAGVEHLGTMLDEFRPDVVVLDPLVSLCAGGNMNDNAAMSLVMRAIKELAIRYNCSFLVIHHTKKGGDLHSSEAIGGAVAIVNLARRALMLVGMSQDEAKKLAVLPSKRWRYFRLLSAKANLAPPASDDDWYELRSVELPNPEPPTYPHGDGVQAIAKATLSAGGGNSGVDMSSVEKAVLEVVDAGKLVGGTRVPYSPNKTGAANARGLNRRCPCSDPPSGWPPDVPCGPARGSRSSHLKPKGFGGSGGGRDRKRTFSPRPWPLCRLGQHALGCRARRRARRERRRVFSYGRCSCRGGGGPCPAGGCVVNVLVNWSMDWSIIGQLVRQAVVVNCPPFRGALTATAASTTNLQQVR